MNIDFLKSKLSQYGISPTKSKGQNFLMDQGVIDRMVKGVSSDDLVIEIGPGLGVLTEALAQKAKEVLLIELDDQIIAFIKKEILPKYENVTLIEGDALSSEVYHQMNGWLSGRKFKVVANLPYQITSKIIRQLLEAEPKPETVTVMVQKEVAQRMTADPGKTSLLSLAVQVYSQAEIQEIVPGKSFFPAPKVDSAVVHCNLGNPSESYTKLSDDQRQKFWQIAKIGFASRRKQLKNNLKSLFDQDQIDKAFLDAGLESNARAQELSIDQWTSLVLAIDPV